jgi:hypothetical protein
MDLCFIKVMSIRFLAGIAKIVDAFDVHDVVSLMNGW